MLFIIRYWYKLSNHYSLHMLIYLYFRQVCLPSLIFSKSKEWTWSELITGCHCILHVDKVMTSQCTQDCLLTSNLSLWCFEKDNVGLNTMLPLIYLFLFCYFHAGDFLKTLQDSDLNVRRVALAMFNSAAHNKPSLIRDQLSTVLPHLYNETKIRRELIREVWTWLIQSIEILLGEWGAEKLWLCYFVWGYM